MSLTLNQALDVLAQHELDRAAERGEPARRPAAFLAAARRDWAKNQPGYILRSARALLAHQATVAQRLSPLDRAERLYHARLAAYPDEGQHAAVEYAIDGVPMPHGRDRLECELRDRVLDDRSRA